MKRLLAATALAALTAGQAVASDAPQPQMQREHVEIIATQGTAPGLDPTTVLFFVLTVAVVIAAASSGSSSTPAPLRVPARVMGGNLVAN